MDENKHFFKFDSNVRLIFILAYRQYRKCNFKCITGINVFTASFLFSNLPLYERLLSSGKNNDQIVQLAIDMLQETALIYGFHSMYSTITIRENTFPISEEVSNIINKATDIAKNHNKDIISYDELLEACCECMPIICKSFIVKTKIHPISNSNLKKEDISMNIPINLSDCLTIFNSKFSPDEEECNILGRDEETKSLIITLAKDTKRNAVLVGEPGVGKTAIVEKLTWLIVTGNCPAKFQDYIIVSLDVNSIIAGTQLRGSAEDRFKSLVDFLNDYPNCILFIDEIHTLLGAGACRDGDLDLANALKPILARNTTQVIGATTSEEYDKYFSRDGALKRRFEKIVVKEPKIHEVYPMIKNQIKRLSKSHGVLISKEIIDMAIFYASCFNKETKNPDRSLDLIDRAMATAELAGKKDVSRDDVLDNFNLNYQIFEETPDTIKIGLAYHESGHCLVHRLSNELYDYRTTALSIMPADDYYGAHVYDINENVIPSRTYNYFVQLIGCKLAGRIAEEMFSGNLSAGASQDLENATRLAKAAITQYGLSKTFSTNRVYSFKDDSIPLTREKNVRIDNEVDYLLTRAEMYVKYIFKYHSVELETLVNALLERHMMSGEEIDELFNSSTIPTNSISIDKL